MENTSQKTCTCCGAGDCACDCRSGSKCNCPHHKAVPVFIILIACTFLAGQWELLGEGAVGIIWPILLAAIGFTKLFSPKCTCC